MVAEATPSRGSARPTAPKSEVDFEARPTYEAAMTSTAQPPTAAAPPLRYVARARLLGAFAADLVIRRPGESLDGDCLEVFVAQRRIVTSLVHWRFPGGQVEIRSPFGPVHTVAFDPALDPRTLLRDDAAWVDDAQLVALARTLTALAAWTSEDWIDAGRKAFSPRLATGSEYQVPPWQADFLELGGSPDDKIPFLTLRIGRVHDEIVDDHSYLDGQMTHRRIVVRETLDAASEAGRSSVEAQFGPEVAEVGAWLAAHRGDCFARVAGCPSPRP
jgi:hypothetical protein